MIRTAVLSLSLLALNAQAAQAAQATEVARAQSQLKAPVQSLRAAAAGLRLRLAGGGAYLVTLEAGGIRLRPTAAAKRPALSDDALPDTAVAVGGRNIAAAWFTEPTRRYPHGVLGDAIEAGGIKARAADGSVVSLTLDAGSVFEDRVPRLADLDGDGADEILAVRAYQGRGAALAVISAGGGRLEIVAEAAPIGLPNRWLNPAGVGDFDGDGRAEAAVVITPHIGGTLRLYEWRGDTLAPDGELFGYSNHAIGARELDLAAVADINSDGTPDIVLPDDARRRIEAVTFAGGTARTILDFPVGGELAGPVAAHDLDGDGRPEIAYVLDGNVLVVADPSP